MSKTKALVVRDGKTDVSPALPLSPKEREFCENYFQGEWAGNATRSFMAVHPNANYGTASIEASALLREPRVKAHLAELHAKATSATAAKLQPWADLLPMAQSVIVATAEGRLRNRMAYEASTYLVNRVVGLPVAISSNEVVVRDGRRITQALDAFHKRVAEDRQLKASERVGGDEQR